jgi:hypothetical protein
MSGDSVTIDTLKLLLAPGEKRADAQAAEIREIKQQQIETNGLLREIVLTHSQTLNQHIKEYAEDKRKDGRRFAKIFQTLEAREGYFTAAGYIKIGVGIILTAIIAAAATDWYKTKFEKKVPTEIKAEVKVG